MYTPSQTHKQTCTHTHSGYVIRSLWWSLGKPNLLLYGKVHYSKQELETEGKLLISLTVQR